jgi:DNA-binding CsgD family transcriptional regulator
MVMNEPKHDGRAHGTKNGTQSRPRLSWREQDAIIRLWNELAEFPASSPHEALSHCLSTLTRLVSGVNAIWVGAARDKEWERNSPSDPLLGWRPHASMHLYPEEAWRRANAMAMVAARSNRFDPHTVALASRFGRHRSHLREELVSDRELKKDWMHHEVLRPLGIGDRVVCAFAAAPGAESYLIFDRESGTRRFGQRERDVLAFFLRGGAQMHRELLQAYGLLGAMQPLSRREREVLRLLLTGVSEREIAQALGLAFATTHQYVGALLRKFGAGSRAELMAQWLRHLAPSSCVPQDSAI